jgi:hypothetical protein
MLDDVAGFTFRLFSPDGDELGHFVTAVPNWRPGDKFLTGDGRRFRILAIVAAPDEDLRGYCGFV